MARKKLGVVELRWTCPKCNTLNLGTARTCQSCGAPQPEDVRFELPERQELVTDESAKAKAAAGPDIHCPYCGARNPAASQTCSQCSGDLSEGALRKTGLVLGAFKSGPQAQLACPRCGAPNPDTATVCQQCGGSLEIKKPAEKAAQPAQPAARPQPWLIVALIVLAIMVCGGIALFSALGSRTQGVTGVVEAVSWERAVSIEGFVPVERQDWQDRIPTAIEPGACEPRLREVVAEPVPDATEVCSTPYSVDTGSGYAEVVQDCEYHVYASYCRYLVDEWAQVDMISASGADLAAFWPDPQLASDQRLGEQRQEAYTIVFSADGEQYSFTTGDYNLFQQAQVGSTWTLNVNSFGEVVSIAR